MSRLGIRHHLTTAYHPQSNGMVERTHRQLKDALRVRLTGDNWLSHIRYVLLSLRATPKEDSTSLQLSWYMVPASSSLGSSNRVQSRQQRHSKSLIAVLCGGSPQGCPRPLQAPPCWPRTWLVPTSFIFARAASPIRSPQLTATACGVGGVFEVLQS